MAARWGCHPLMSVRFRRLTQPDFAVPNLKIRKEAGVSPCSARRCSECIVKDIIPKFFLAFRSVHIVAISRFHKAILQVFRRISSLGTGRVRPIFLGQAVMQQVFHLRKSARRLFSMQNLTASGVLAPAFDQRYLALFNAKIGMHPLNSDIMANRVCRVKPPTLRT